MEQFLCAFFVTSGNPVHVIYIYAAALLQPFANSYIEQVFCSPAISILLLVQKYLVQISILLLAQRRKCDFIINIGINRQPCLQKQQVLRILRIACALPCNIHMYHNV